MRYTKALSSSLQGRAQDVVRAYKSVDDIRIAIEEVRSRVRGEFLSWYKEACDIAAAVKVNLFSTKTVQSAKKQRQRTHRNSGRVQQTITGDTLFRRARGSAAS
jgi:hypothetical protein